jgi:uncharacterized membrane protein YcaP (DUF421 family)
MSWISGNWIELGSVTGKAALMYATALLGLRLGERRTLAQWSIIDFVTAVAIGAIVGRTAIASSQSFITGAAALLTLIVIHRLASLLRFTAVFRRLGEHRVRVLVEHGWVHHGQLRRCGLTETDLFAQLRQQGAVHLEASGTCFTKPPGASQSYGRTPNLGLSSSRPLSRVRLASTGSSGEQ